MAKSIKWTKRAVAKFDNIIDYLEQNWGFSVAREFVIHTYQVIEIISEHPEIGTLENEKQMVRGFKLSKQNRLF